MKKILLTALCVSATLFATAETKTFFTEDFEWIAPWAEAGKAGNTVGNNNQEETSPQLAKCTVDGVTLRQELENRGYVLVTSSNDNSLYANTNYLKFGKTKVQGSISIPCFTTIEEGASDLKLTFDWSSQRQGSGNWDATEIVVIVKNGDAEEVVFTHACTMEKDAAYAWENLEVALPATLTYNKDTRIVIRNSDAQWGSSKAYRYFLDNIALTGNVDKAGVEDIVVSENAPVEYFNLQGVRVDNPTKGLYITRQGNKVAKVVVK